jgi:hypothetical protein
VVAAHAARRAVGAEADRKSGDSVCEVCGKAANVVYRAHAADTERHFCLEHCEWPVDEVDGVFHQLLSLNGVPWKAAWNASGSQVEQRHARVRASLAPPWRKVMFDWSIGVDVHAETLRTAAEHGWGELQHLYSVSTVFENTGDVFWQFRKEADYLRRAMIMHAAIRAPRSGGNSSSRPSG